MKIDSFVCSPANYCQNIASQFLFLLWGICLYASPLSACGILVWFLLVVTSSVWFTVFLGYEVYDHMPETFQHYTKIKGKTANIVQLRHFQ